MTKVLTRPGTGARCARPGQGSRSALFAVTLLLVTTAACAKQPEEPNPVRTYGGVPDLRGRTVMVTPVQEVRGVGGDPQAEILFALEGRSVPVDWVLPEELVRVASRSPTLGVNPEALSVGIFLQGEVRRIGDPLFREILQLSALVNAEVALIPVIVRYVEPVEASRGEQSDPSDDSGPAAATEGRIEVLAALVNTRNGQVFWTGFVQGDPGPANDPAALASMADRFAQTILP